MHTILQYDTKHGVSKYEGHKTAFYDKKGVQFYDKKLHKIIK